MNDRLLSWYSRAPTQKFPQQRWQVTDASQFLSVCASWPTYEVCDIFPPHPPPSSYHQSVLLYIPLLASSEIASFTLPNFLFCNFLFRNFRPILVQVCSILFQFYCSWEVWHHPFCQNQRVLQNTVRKWSSINTDTNEFFFFAQNWGRYFIQLNSTNFCGLIAVVILKLSWF